MADDLQSAPESGGKGSDEVRSFLALHHDRRPLLTTP
jgi:hypothetical protein